MSNLPTDINFNVQVFLNWFRQQLPFGATLSVESVCRAIKPIKVFAIVFKPCFFVANIIPSVSVSSYLKTKK